jgi:hypothetical protein
MKTVAFTTALTTLVLATAADADAQNRQCRFWGGISVRAGTPCVFGPFGPSAWSHAAFIQGVAPWKGMMFYSSTEIIKAPREGTAVLRTDGSIYYSPNSRGARPPHPLERETGGRLSPPGANPRHPPARAGSGVRSYAPASQARPARRTCSAGASRNGVRRPPL